MKIFLGILAVLGGLLALIALIVALLIIIRFRLIADYKNGELTIWVRILFFKLKLYPSEEKVALRQEWERLRAERRAAREQKKKQPSRPQTSPLKKTEQQTQPPQSAKASAPSVPTRSKKPSLRKALKKELRKATRDFNLNDYLIVIRIIITKFVAKFRCERLMLHASIGGDDAMDIATTYGIANAAVYTILSAFEAAGNLNRCEVQITPDFTSEETVAEGRAEFSFHLTNALKCILELVDNLDNIQLN
ncbi:MAG: DUF2953 domain-containing protein [Clostridia bacterium]|nr:DUF2953 domain-containing protein [Clostridia bacterium]